MSKLYWRVKRSGKWVWEPSLLGNSAIDENGRIFYCGPLPHNGDFRMYEVIDDLERLEEVVDKPEVYTDEES